MNGQSSQLRVGSEDYERHTAAELDHYTNIFNECNPDGTKSSDSLTQWVPGVWA